MTATPRNTILIGDAATRLCRCRMNTDPQVPSES